MNRRSLPELMAGLSGEAEAEDLAWRITTAAEHRELCKEYVSQPFPLARIERLWS